MHKLLSCTGEVNRVQDKDAPFSDHDPMKLERVRWSVVRSLVKELTVRYLTGKFGMTKHGSTVQNHRKNDLRKLYPVLLSLYFLVMLFVISGFLMNSLQDMAKLDFPRLGDGDGQLKNTIGLSFYMSLTFMLTIWNVFVLSVNQPYAFFPYSLYPVKLIEFVWARLIFSLQIWSIFLVGMVVFSACFKESSWGAFWATTVPFFLVIASMVTIISSISIYYDLAVMKKRLFMHLSLWILFHILIFIQVDYWIQSAYLKGEKYELGFGVFWGLYQLVYGWTHPWMVAIVWIFLGHMSALFWSWIAYRTMLLRDRV
ncbi:MAG: hypothetical protein RBR24_04100 [Candidatus Carbobacillus sp.]|nr:hypothetical protein [Candidatus Carbobacillus sp.]